MDKSMPAYNFVLRKFTELSTVWCVTLNPLTMNPYIAPIPRAYNIANAPSPPSSPATNTSLHATPSG